MQEKYHGEIDLVLTQTGDSSIVRVGTVVKANSSAGTVHKSGFIATTLHIVQEDGTSSLAKEGICVGSCTCKEYVLSLDYVRIMN